MLKKLTYISPIIYMLILYGQNIFERSHYICINSCKHNEVCKLVETPRADFYFIGMALVMSLFSYIIFKFEKNISTSYLLFMCIGELINQSIFKGKISYLEVGIGFLGIMYILLEKHVKNLLKR